MLDGTSLVEPNSRNINKPKAESVTKPIWFLGGNEDEVSQVIIINQFPYKIYCILINITANEPISNKIRTFSFHIFMAKYKIIVIHSIT